MIEEKNERVFNKRKVSVKFLLANLCLIIL